MVHVNVDMSLGENQNLKPELEENEFIEVFSIPLKTLYADIKRLEAEGYAIDARVGTLAEGIEVARRWKLQWAWNIYAARPRTRQPIQGYQNAGHLTCKSIKTDLSRHLVMNLETFRSFGMPLRNEGASLFNFGQ